jgi:exonuclease III
MINHNNSKPCKEETNNSKSKLKILQININGIQNKFSELKQIVADTSPDVIVIQESKLNVDSSSSSSSSTV